MLETILLAVVQGVTEWLPVSSSGHLTLIQQTLGYENPVFFDVMLHFGTLIVILAVFRRQISKIAKTVFSQGLSTPEGETLKHIVVGTIPITVAYFFFGEEIKALFTNLYAVAVAFMITGVFLFLTLRRRKIERIKLTYLDSIFIGVAQAFALVPGLSRSGLTIATALLLGIERGKAAEFSFLLAVPAVVAAVIEESLTCNLAEVDLLAVVVGVIVAVIVGYVALMLLLHVVRKGRLYLFSIYCWVIGALVLLFTF